jgi:hypothetical protein
VGRLVATLPALSVLVILATTSDDGALAAAAIGGAMLAHAVSEKE